MPEEYSLPGGQYVREMDENMAYIMMGLLCMSDGGAHTPAEVARRVIELGRKALGEGVPTEELTERWEDAVGFLPMDEYLDVVEELGLDPSGMYISEPSRLGKREESGGSIWNW